ACFADESFDFVYSYALFQHIPSRDVVLSYLAEAHRVLRPEGILRCQINGLSVTAARYTTWEGVRIQAEEIEAFARERDFQLLALEGAGTQYMWTTLRKKRNGWRRSLDSRSQEHAVAVIRNITSAYSEEPAIPASGPLAAASLWIENMPEDADLAELSVDVGDMKARLTYLGPPDSAAVSQLNLLLPSGIRTGLVPMALRWLKHPMAAGWMRVIPACPLVPHICSVTEGVDLLSEKRFVSRSAKVVIEEVPYPEQFGARLSGRPVEGAESFCADPLARRYEFNFRVPDGLRGACELVISLGGRRFAPIQVEVE